MTRFAFGAMCGSAARPPVLGCAIPAVPRPATQRFRTDQRSERGNADTASREAEELPTREMEIDFAIDSWTRELDAHPLIAS